MSKSAQCHQPYSVNASELIIDDNITNTKLSLYYYMGHDEIIGNSQRVRSEIGMCDNGLIDRRRLKLTAIRSSIAGRFEDKFSQTDNSDTHLAYAIDRKHVIPVSQILFSACHRSTSS